MDLSSDSHSPNENTRDRYRILIVEDNQADIFLIREAISHADLPSHLEFATDGEKAIEIIVTADRSDTVAVPDLVLLDLNLPRLTGSEVLQHIRRSRRCAATPVLVVTSSDSERDRRETEKYGASGYFVKPSSYGGFMELGAAVKALLRPALTERETE